MHALGHVARCIGRAFAHIGVVLRYRVVTSVVVAHVHACAREFLRTNKRGALHLVCVPCAEESCMRAEPSDAWRPSWGVLEECAQEEFWKNAQFWKNDAQATRVWNGFAKRRRFDRPGIRQNNWFNERLHLPVHRVNQCEISDFRTCMDSAEWTWVFVWVSQRVRVVPSVAHTMTHDTTSGASNSTHNHRWRCQVCRNATLAGKKAFRKRRTEESEQGATKEK